MKTRNRSRRRQDRIINEQKEKEEEEKKESIIHHLPEDVLWKIFSYLEDIDHLKSTSLVCKQFCSISSPIVHKLTLKNSSLTYSNFKRLFERFPGVKKIYFDFFKLDSALLAISNSGLNLEKLQLPLFHCRRMSAQYPKVQTMENMSTSRVIKSIKSLELDWFYGTASQQQVIDFVNLFPSLTELDINDCDLWNDKGIHEVISKLPKLRRISLGYNNDVAKVTNNILYTLSSHCPELESVNFQGCKFTPEALHKFFCNNPHLRSVYMPDFDSHMLSEVSKVVGCMQILQNLNHLYLKSEIVQDAVLLALVESRPPLKSLLIGYSSNFLQRYTMAGLSQMLSAYPSIESLDICLPNRIRKKCKTHDAEMSIVVKKLVNTKHITIRSRVVCQATLFSLVQNCPLLETILIERYDRHPSAKKACDHGMEKPTKKNHSIKSIQISPESDIWLRSIVESHCPKLRK